jgi:hypothetical protein
MSIDFDAKRWERVRETARLWWAGKLQRPLIHLWMGGRKPDRPEPKQRGWSFASYYPLSVPAEEIVDRWDYDLSGQRFLGDAFPSVWPNFGPGVIAAFLGCDLRNGEPPHETAWFHPKTEKEIAAVRFRFDPDAVWYKRIREIAVAAQKRWNGQVQVAMTDLGGNLDILSSFRPSEKLLLDLYDFPDEVKRLTWEAHEMWWRYYEELHKAQRPPNPGYTAWTPLFSEEPYYMLQCDFCYMIGPGMFDEFVKPELAASCRKLKNAFYHLDGPGQLPHLDSLLTIPELRGVQWVPGSGQPDSSHWPEVFRKIRKAGKLVQGFFSLKELDSLAAQLGSVEGFALHAWIGEGQEKEAREVLRRYGAPEE